MLVQTLPGNWSSGLKGDPGPISNDDSSASELVGGLLDQLLHSPVTLGSRFLHLIKESYDIFLLLASESRKVMYSQYSPSGTICGCRSHGFGLVLMTSSSWSIGHGSHQLRTVGFPP